MVETPRSSLCHLQLANRAARAAQIGEPHFRILARQQHAIGAPANGCQNRLARSLRRRLAVILSGRDVNIYAWPQLCVAAFQACTRSAGGCVGGGIISV